MSDQARSGLQHSGAAAGYMCSPRADAGEPPREVFVDQLRKPSPSGAGVTRQIRWSPRSGQMAATASLGLLRIGLSHPLAGKAFPVTPYRSVAAKTLLPHVTLEGRVGFSPDQLGDVRDPK